MAEYDLKIATIRMDVNYTQTPDPGAVSGVIDTDYVERTAEVSTTSGSWVYDWMMDGSTFNPASYYAVWVQGAFGGNTNKTDAELQVVLGPEASPTIYGYAKARGYENATAIPGSQRAGNLSRVFVVNNPNQYDLGVRYLSDTGQSVFIEGLSMMKIELDPNLLTANDDWLYSQFTGTSAYYTSGVVGSDYTVYENTFTITEPGEYALWTNCEVTSTNPSGPEDRWLSTEVNGTSVGTWWYKYNKAATDRHNYYAMNKVSLLAGTTTIKILGRAQAGSGTRSYWRPGIFMLRLNKFSNYLWVDGPQAWQTQILDVHPSFSTVMSGTFSIPTGTDTNVAMWGGMQLRRGNYGGKIVRLDMQGTKYGDFMCDANTTGSVTGDEPYVYSFGVRSVNVPVNYRLEATNGSDFVADSTEYRYPKVLLLSTTVETGPLMEYTADVEDTIGFSQDITPKSYDVTDNIGVGEVVPYTVTGSGSARPGTTHPRLWFCDSAFYNGCLAAKAANTAEWQQFQSGFGAPSLYIRGYFEAIWYALEYVFNDTNKDTALAYLQSELRADLPSHSVNDNFRLWAETARNIACAYDWLKWKSPADITPELDEEVHNWFMLTSYLRYTARQNPLADQILGSDSWEWASNNPKQNFYEGSMMAMAYAAIILENSPYLAGTATRLRTGTTAPGFEWPFNDGSATNGFITWEIPFDDWDHSRGFHTDPWEFVVRRIEEMTLPALDDRVAGGDWLEGSNYGRGALRRHMEMLNIIRLSSGLDYARDPAHPWHAQIPVAQIHNIQPGNSRLHFTGDLGGNLPMAKNNYNQCLMLMCANALQGKPEGAYAQHWLTNVSNGMDTGVNEMIPFDFLMYRSTYTSNDYTSTRNPWNTADGTGTVNSRTNWLDDNTAVSFNQIAQDVDQGHIHHDGGGIQMYVGGQATADYGWYLADQQIKYGASDLWPSMAHNCVAFNNGVNTNILGQRFTDTGRPVVASLDRDIHTSTYTYTQVNLGNGYDVTLTDKVESGVVVVAAPRAPDHYSDGDDDILNAYHRESVFLRSIGPYLVVYDRAEMGSVNNTTGGFYSSNYNIMQMRQYWQFIENQPTSVGGGVYRYDGGTDKRMFIKIYNSSNLSFQDTSGTVYSFYTMIAETGSTDQYKDLIAVMQPTTTSTAAPTASEQFSGTDLVVSGSYAVGVCIKDASAYQAVVFCTDTSGEFPQADGFGTPMLLQYTAPQGANNTHTVCNMLPNRSYTVTEAHDGTDIVVSITHSQSTDNVIANSAGVLEFDPLNLNTASDYTYTITDGIGASDGSAKPVGYGWNVTDNIGMDAPAVYGLASAEQFTPISSSLLTDTAIPSYGFPLKDKARIVDEVTYSTSGNPPRRKTINTLVKSLMPFKMGQSGWVGNPNDATPHTKIDNGVDTPDDSEYIVAAGLASASNVASIHITPDSTISSQRIRVRVRTREIEHIASPTLTLQVEIYKPDFTLIDIQSTSLASGFNYQTINFPWIDYVDGDFGGTQGIVIFARAVSPTWDADTRVELSELELQVHYKGLEKSIGGPPPAVTIDTTGITGDST